MILVFEIELLAYIQAITKSTRNGLRASLGSTVLDLAHDTNRSNGRAIEVALDGKIFFELVQLRFTCLLRTLFEKFGNSVGHLSSLHFNHRQPLTHSSKNRLDFWAKANETSRGTREF